MKKQAIRLAAIFAGWTLLGIFWSLNRSIYRVAIDRPAGLVENFRTVLPDYWLWALLTPAIFFFARKFPFSRRTWLLSSVVHFAAYIALSVLHETLALLLRIPTYVPAGFHGSMLKLRVAQSLNEDFWMYWPIVVIWSLVEYYQRYRERDVKASQLSERLARAELQALRNQLHPHFLFNALNSLAALLHEDIEAADDMLADLAHLLRAYLTGSDEQEIQLAREVDLLNTYVRIQQRRFEDRIEWTTDIPPELSGAMIPALLLQPLVENAILHGIAPRAGPGIVQVRVRSTDPELCLEVLDDGVGLPESLVEGVGLANTRARLQQLYGDGQSLEIRPASPAGTRVRVTLPLRLATMKQGPDENTNTDRGRRASGAPADSVVARA